MGDTVINTAVFTAVAHTPSAVIPRFPSPSQSGAHFLFGHLHFLPLGDEIEEPTLILQSG